MPQPHDVFDVPLDDGATIRVRRHGKADGRVRLYASHGNGFAIDGYLPFWSRLADRCELLVFDARNHGQNAPSDPARHNYAQMARDLERVHETMTARLGPKISVGAFHSMSGRAAMKHAIEIGWRWDALVLFDPPNMPPADHAVYPAMSAFENKLTSWARDRRARFADPSELAQDYAQPRANRGWVAGAHELMARAVLRRDPAGGGWVLACAPVLEAAIYHAALALDLWPPAASFRGPVKLLGADPELPYGPPTGLANRALAVEQGYDYAAIPGTGHMLQLERPDACADALLGFLAAQGIRP
ncbi:MAG TPA: alpha/beta hydrolase [Candidatus Sulfotelmatobacter sp.]|nr:alpha/beta hydrolase [Candidatus Sulfotelmatobacter sp.]